MYHFPDIRHVPDIAIQHFLDGAAIQRTDLLPHDRGGGGDPGDVLEAACGDGLHFLIGRIRIVHHVHQTCGDEVGQMTDRRHDVVVFLCFHSERDGAQGCHQLFHIGHHIPGYVSLGGEDIVGIFDQVVGGMAVTAFLRARHGMSADEPIGEP